MNGIYPDMKDTGVFDDSDKLSGTPCNQEGDCCAQREKGKSVLRKTINRLRRKADDLQVLVDMLPERPTPEQDEALWQIATTIEW